MKLGFLNSESLNYGRISRKLRMAVNSPTSFSGNLESGLRTASNCPIP